jgi:hypothetical protein
MARGKRPLLAGRILLSGGQPMPYSNASAQLAPDLKDDVAKLLNVPSPFQEEYRQLTKKDQ